MAQKTVDSEMLGLIITSSEGNTSKAVDIPKSQDGSITDLKRRVRRELEKLKPLFESDSVNTDEKWYAFIADSIIQSVEFYPNRFNIKTDPQNHLTRVRAGESRSRVDEVAATIGLTDKEMAQILTVSERTLHRKSYTEQLDPNMSERLLLLERLIQHGLEVFDSRKETLARWLRSPRPSLGNVPPISTLDTIVGFRFVDDELSRIEEGLIS